MSDGGGEAVLTEVGPVVDAAPVVDTTAVVDAPAHAPEPVIEPIPAQVPETESAQIPAPEPIAPESEPIPAQIPPSPQPVQDPPQQAPIQPENLAHKFLAMARSALGTRKQKRMQKILALVEKRGRVTNAEVQKLLRVSDATATRYLSELERQGRVRQVGASGPKVVYTKI